MKRAGIVLVLLLFLAGCSKSSGELERGIALRARLLAAESCGFDAAVTADYGDKVYAFSMNCEVDSAGALSFTVSEPETIAGITGTVSDTGGKLTFDDTALQFDLMADDQVTPVSAPWILMKTLRSGYITSAGMEDGQLRLSIDDSYDDDALHLDIWLNADDRPARAEILYDGRRILSMDVSNFEIR